MKCDVIIIHQRSFKYLIMIDYFIINEKYNNGVKKEIPLQM